MWGALGLALCVGVLVLLACEQLFVYLRRRGTSGNLPGPTFVLPLLGGLARMIKDPAGFWEQQRLFNPTGLSSNYLVGKFMVFSADNDVNRAILSNNGPNGFDMALHPNARWIFGDTNIAFMHGPALKALRNSFLSLFQPSSLGKYLELQEVKIREHIQRWVVECGPATGKPVEIRPFIRDLNLATSQTVFLGSYVPDPVEFNQHYLNLTNGWLVAPIPLPGFPLYDAIQSRKAVIKIIESCAEKSKAAMRTGTAPACLMDYWAIRCMADAEEAIAAGNPPPVYSGSHQMAETMMDFLFAAQDASTASLCWVMALMADRPDILARVRSEQLSARPNDEPITFEGLSALPFTRQVILEILRYRPPAMMVPQIANKDVKLTEEYTAKKGSLVIPSLWASCRNGFVNGEEFDPDRYAEDREDTWRAHAKSFMTFGCGPHACVGQKYAINHLVCFLSVVSTSLDWTRTRTPISDNVDYLPTLYPADCLLTVTSRLAASTAQ